MKMLSSVMGFFLMLGNMVLPAQAKPMDKFIIYYSNKAPLDAFKPYELLVLDSQYHPPLAPLAEQGKMLLGYISLGEVEMHRSHYKEVRKEGILLQENENWKGSYFVDMRDPRWSKRVIEELIPAILAQGFDGLFFDTLDNPAALERQDPVRYRGMTKAAAQLVQSIRMHYPHIKIMLNRGYELLPDVAGSIDMVLGESVYADYNFDSKNYGLVHQDSYREQVRMLKKVKEINPNLAIYTLDYSDKKDKKFIASIYREQRKNGFIPYVSTVALNEIVEEPK